MDKKSKKNQEDTVCVYTGQELRADLKDRAQKLGYTNFSEFVRVLLEAAPDIPAAELPRLRQEATLMGVSLAEAYQDRLAIGAGV